MGSGKKNKKGLHFSTQQKQRGTFQSNRQYNNQSSNSKGTGRTASDSGTAGWAKAPYNFVPLNTQVVPCPHNKLDNPDFGNTYDPGLETGYIECELETVTPLFIGQEQNRDAKGRSTEPLQFFSIDGMPRIPGSSLRGMVRNLVEIVSWSKFTGINAKRKLYFREVADSNSSLGNHYRELLQKGQVRSGVLKQRRRKYFIQPSNPVNGDTIFVVSDKVAKTIGFDGEFEFREVYFLPTKRGRRGFPRVTQLSNEDKSGYVKGLIVASGNFKGKKNHWIISMPQNGKELEIPEDVVNDYRLDKSRNPKADLLERLKKCGSNGVPCFYIQDNEEKIVAFGHTYYFRIPYRHPIGAHIPKALVDPKIIDIPEALFGKETKFATRVFFEDARLSEKKTDIFTVIGMPRLESPKPTSYQLYLEQLSNSKEELRHWDHDKAHLRGFKLYWHKRVDAQSLRDVSEHEAHFKVQAIKPGVKFRFRIRFENLDPIELGALLFVLNPPDNLRHKLGMGKPVGLGSVKISTKLVVSNRLERYSKLFDGTTWNLSEKQTDPHVYIAKFERYVLECIGATETSLWEHPRMRSLHIMLDWKNTTMPNWAERTAYMKRGQFKKQVLPTPENVVKMLIN